MPDLNPLAEHWYYDTESGELSRSTAALAEGNLLIGAGGWHELNISGSATQAEAEAEAKKEFPNGKAPTTSITKGLENTGGIGTGLAGVYQVVTNLGNPNTWVRVAKVIVGGALLLIGLAHMTGADNAVASAARKVPVPI